MNPSTLQARVLVDELIRGGVTEVVLCPGSRNAPLSFAFYDADAAGRLRLHVRIDERTAGFLAVGLAIGSGNPVPIVMTSGTAVANISPAVFEANYARVPLIVLSANRPYELLGSGANQTIEQFGIFGTQVRAAISLGLAEEGVDTNSQWRSAVGRVLSAARGARTGNAGPVQFDIPLREPLAPDVGDEIGSDLGTFVGRPNGKPWTESKVGVLDIPVPIDISRDTVVIAGHGSALRPELSLLPTVFEPTAPQPDNPLHPVALAHLKPQQAIICGRPTLHREVSALLANPAVEVYALTTGPRWPDVSGNVLVTGTRAEISGVPHAQWLTRCREIQSATQNAVAKVLAETTEITGLQVAQAVSLALQPGDQFVVGASNPIRDVALAGNVDPQVTVRSNRGVAGIDGTISTAIGAALGADVKTVALLGDLTFIHDNNGLLIGSNEPIPKNLTIVVANDNGGGIFSTLEYGAPRFTEGKFAAGYERVMGTSHGTDLKQLCAAHGISYRLAEIFEIPEIIKERVDNSGIVVVEIKTARAGLRSIHALLRETVAEEIAMISDLHD